MSLDLDKAEIMLEQYYEKISEQENLILQLREQCKEEVIAKDNILFQRNKREFAPHFRNQFDDDNLTISRFSNDLISEDDVVENISPLISPETKIGSSDTSSQQSKEIRQNNSVIVRKLFSEKSENYGQLGSPSQNSFISSCGSKSRGISEPP